MVAGEEFGSEVTYEVTGYLLHMNIEIRCKMVTFCNIIVAN